MEREKINAIVDDLIEREGRWKYTNRKNDLGGPTFAGVTLKTLNKWSKKHGGEALTPAEFESAARAATKDPNHPLRNNVRVIYEGEFIKPFVGLPRGLRELTIDAGVNCGWPRAARWCQQAVGSHPDGIVGPKTLRKARDLWRKQDARRAALVDFSGQRLEYYGRLCKRRPEQVENLVGWQRRTIAVLGEAMEVS